MRSSTHQRRLRSGVLPLACLVSVCLLSTGIARAEVVELRAFRQSGWLRLDLRARDLLDPRTMSTIESGLPGTCVYHVRVEDREGLVVQERLLELSLRFDLWGGRYLLEGPNGPQSLPSLAAADSAWSHLAGEPVCPLERLLPAVDYRLAVRIAVRPLAAADRERLSLYVSRHSGGSGEQVNLDLGAVLADMFGRRQKGERTVEFTGTWFRTGTLEEGP